MRTDIATPSTTIGIRKRQRGARTRRKRDLAGLGGAAIAATNAPIDAGGEKVHASFHNSKFLGEKCSDNTQCNQVTSAHVAMACARASKTCLLKEDADRQHSLAGLSRAYSFDIRSLGHQIHVYWFNICVNYKDCGGAECTLTTRDGNKYCHHTDASNAKCLNCALPTTRKIIENIQ